MTALRKYLRRSAFDNWMNGRWLAQVTFGLFLAALALLLAQLYHAGTLFDL